jgi:transcriptional regulator with XRE-family HTH domain
VAIKLSELLFEKLLVYQQTTGSRKTLKQFAEYIGIGQVSLNRLMNERRSAGEKTVALLAEFFKDDRFYDAVGLPRPDPELKYITRHWGETPDEVRHKTAEEFGRYTTEPPPENGS